jgi:hypothetical protein
MRCGRSVEVLVGKKPEGGRQPFDQLRSYYGAGLFLAERGARRVTRYYRDLVDLTREGSLEPRLWIGSVETFWGGLAEDYGDFFRRIAGAKADVVESVDSGVCFIDIVEGQRVAELTLPIPGGLFEGASFQQAELRTSGLWHREQRVLRPNVHLSLTPRIVTQADRQRCELRFHDLPDGLLAGLILAGTVTASPAVPVTGAAPPASRLVAVVQVRIV